MYLSEVSNNLTKFLHFLVLLCYLFDSFKSFLTFSVTTGSPLYQFLLQLLDQKQNETIIKWIEKKDGVFQIINKNRLAELWGKHRQRKMTYESLSRAIRHYYKQNIMQANPVKLRYQFTTSTLDEWQRMKKSDEILM